MKNREKIKIAKMKLFDYAIGDILRAIDGKSLVGAFIQCFCFLSYMAEINDDKGKDWEKYEKYIKNFLNKNLKGGMAYDEKKLYAIRCSLVHTYGSSDAMKKAYLIGYNLTHNNSSFHKKYENNVYTLNLNNFIFDIIKTTSLFFKSLENKKNEELEPYCFRATQLLSVLGNNQEFYQKEFSAINKRVSLLDNDNIDWNRTWLDFEIF